MPKSTLHYFHFVLLLTRDTCSDAKSYVCDKDGIQKMNFRYSVDVIFKDAGAKRHLKLCEFSRYFTSDPTRDDYTPKRGRHFPTRLTYSELCVSLDHSTRHLAVIKLQLASLHLERSSPYKPNKQYDGLLLDNWRNL